MKESRGSVFSSFVTTGKDFIAMLRDGMLLVLVVLLVIWPQAINNILVEAGFEEGSFAGIKWRAKLEESDDALLEAQTALADLIEQNRMLNEALTGIEQKAGNKAVQANIVKLQALNVRLSKSSEEAKAMLAKSTSANAPLIQKVQNSSGLLKTWGIVYGADSTKEKAQHEVTVTASRFGLINTAIYYRNNYYRSVAMTANRVEADQLLNKAKNHRSDAYIVNMSSWCPDSEEKDGYFECVAP